ncbi:hypothetical protein BDQ17DRAFT_1338194 [Cyathus striatus]|nr:hypothetical protein BDQ17DRAFT_1338194 [Cyathus striatus]
MYYTLLDETIAVVEAAATVWCGRWGDSVSATGDAWGNIVIAVKQWEGVKEEDVGVGARVVVLSLLPLLLWVLGAVDIDVALLEQAWVQVWVRVWVGAVLGIFISVVGGSAAMWDQGQVPMMQGEGGRREEGGPSDMALMPFILVTLSSSLHRAQVKRREKGELGDVAGEGRQWCSVDDSRTLVPLMMLWRSNIEVGDGEVEDVIVGKEIVGEMMNWRRLWGSKIDDSVMENRFSVKNENNMPIEQVIVDTDRVHYFQHQQTMVLGVAMEHYRDLYDPLCLLWITM